MFHVLKVRRRRYCCRKIDTKGERISERYSDIEMGEGEDSEREKEKGSEGENLI